MRKRNIFLAVLVAVFFMVATSYSAVLVTNLGTHNSSGKGPISIDTDRIITIAADAGLVNSYELAITNDTLTAVDSGKTFIVDPSSQTTFILPDADVGMGFKFYASDGAATKKIVLEPQATDYFRGMINSAAVTTFSTADSIISPGNTGDMLEVFCAENLYWDVVGQRGTWVDNN